MPKTISILIADHQAMFREGLACLFRSDKRFSLAGEADNPTEALTATKKLKPNVVLLDAMLSPNTDFGIIQDILKASPNSRIIVMGNNLKANHIQSAIQAGVSGCISKNATFEELTEAIRKVQDGERYLSTELSALIIKNFVQPNAFQQARYEKLTPKEKLIFKRIAEGGKVDTITEEFKISRQTFYRYRSTILVKMGVETIAELVRIAIDSGIVGEEGRWG
jgi:DNA-binding NarL/FixJ family response regulator